MKKYHFIYIVLLSFFLLPAGALGQTFKWALGAGAHSGDYNLAVRTDSEGNLYTVGLITDQSVIGDRFIVEDSYHLTKQKPNGEILWTKLIAHNFNQAIYDFHIDANDQLYLVGNHNGGGIVLEGKKYVLNNRDACYILSLNKNGEVNWFKGFPYNIKQITGDGQELVIAGVFGKSIQLGPYFFSDEKEGLGCYVAKMNASHEITWASSGQGVWRVSDLVLDAHKNIFLSGYTEEYDCSFNDHKINTYTTTSFFMKYTADGSLGWVKSFHSRSLMGSPVQTAVDQENNLYVSMPVLPESYADGYEVKEYGSIILKYATDGRLLWGHELKGCTEGCALAIDDDNALIVAVRKSYLTQLDFYPGKVLDTSNGRLLLAKFHPLGFQQWARSTRGYPYDIQVGKNRNIYIVGSFSSGSIYFDDHVITNNSWNSAGDMFITCLNDPTSLYCPEVKTELQSREPYICDGDTTVLSMKRSYGSFFKWKHNGVDLLPQDSVIAITEGGEYQLYINEGTECPDISTKFTIQEYSYPEINLQVKASPILCPGDSVILTTEKQPDYIFKWFGDDEILAEAKDSVLVIRVNGKYKLEVSNGYCAITDSVEVSSMAIPVLSVRKDTIAYSGYPIIIQSSVMGAAIPKWYYNGAKNEFSREINLETSIQGHYLVIADNHCGMDVKQVVVFDSRVGVDDVFKSAVSLSLFPNPCTTALNLGFKGFEPGDIQVEILNVKGKVISITTKWLTAEYESLSVNTNYLRPGTYFARITQGAKTTVKKFIVTT